MYVCVSCTDLHVLCLDVGAVLHEEAAHRHMPIPHPQVQRRVALRALGMHQRRVRLHILPKT
jgi:hypothetical protein